MSNIEEYFKCNSNDMYHVYNDNQEGLVYMAPVDDKTLKKGTCTFTGNAQECLQDLSETRKDYETDPPMHIVMELLNG